MQKKRSLPSKGTRLHRELANARLVFHATPTSNIPAIEREGITSGGFWKIIRSPSGVRYPMQSLLRSGVWAVKMAGYLHQSEEDFHKSPSTYPLTLLVVDENKIGIPGKDEGTQTVGGTAREYKYPHVPASAIVTKVRVTKKEITRAHNQAIKIVSVPGGWKPYTHPRDWVQFEKNGADANEGLRREHIRHETQNQIARILMMKAWKHLHSKGIIHEKPAPIPLTTIRDAHQKYWNQTMKQYGYFSDQKPLS